MRGRPGDVARELLDGGHHAEVLALVAEARREERGARAHHRVARVRNRSEVVPSEQLALILEELRTTVVGANEAESEQSAADKNLDAAAEKNGKRTETTKPPKQPAVRRPPPPGLRRVDNPIAVPDDERQCPKCGANRRSSTTRRPR
ncbi:MAG: hypothetical protein IPM79_39715 [Polyangiaceae bacterium]|nr:hypothetical protein [Polyangiaceae bacterium]